MPSHQPFYFKGSELLLSVNGSWSGSMCKAHTALKNFGQLPWCCIQWLFSYPVRLLPCIWITALLKLIYVIKVVQFLLSFQTGLPDIESQWQVQYYSYSSIHSYPSQCGSWLAVMGMFASRVETTSSHWPSCISTLWSIRGVSVGITMCHVVSAVLHLGKSTTSRDLGDECIQPSLDVSGKLCLSSCISSSGSIQVSGGTCCRSIWTSDSSGVKLGGGSLASHSSQHVGRHSPMLFSHKRSHHGCLSRPGAQGSAISTFNPLASQRYVLHRLRFSS